MTLDCARAHAIAGYDLWRRKPLGAAKNVAFEIGERGAGGLQARIKGEKAEEQNPIRSLLHPIKHAEPMSFIGIVFKAYDTYEMHEAMMEAGEAVNEVRELEWERYNILGELNRADADISVGDGFWGSQFHLNADGQLYRTDGRPLVRY